MIKVLLFDDNQIMLDSIGILIGEEKDITLLGAYSNALIDTKYFEHADVILMDIDMPGVNGVDAVRILRNKGLKLPILMLTVFEENEYIFNAICAGADGYILKKNAFSELIPSIRSVLTGGAPMSTSIARKVLQMVAVKDKKTSFNLTQQEQNVLQNLVDGKSYKMIAASLFISIDTVRFHIKNIYDKLHVHSATEAVKVALKNNLVE